MRPGDGFTRSGLVQRHREEKFAKSPFRFSRHNRDSASSVRKALEHVPWVRLAIPFIQRTNKAMAPSLTSLPGAGIREIRMATPSSTPVPPRRRSRPGPSARSFLRFFARLCARPNDLPFSKAYTSRGIENPLRQQEYPLGFSRPEAARIFRELEPALFPLPNRTDFVLLFLFS